MTKDKKIFFLITIILLISIIAIASISAVYAYSVFVNYNYNYTTEADQYSVAYGTSGSNQTITVSQTANNLDTITVDLITVSESQDARLNSTEPSYCIPYTVEENTYYRAVFENYAITNPITVTGGTVSVVKVTPNTVRFTDSDHEVTNIAYRNIYIKSAREFEYITAQKNYDNIFDYIDNYFQKTVMSRNIFLIDDVTLDDYTLNIPCSINLLNSTLTLNGDFTIAHSYSGAYYLETAEPNSTYGLSEGALVIAEGKRLSIKTPKAYCTFATSVNNYLTTENFTAIYDFDSYGTLLMSDALDFAENLIPTSIYNDLILQPYFQTYGVAYSYQIVNGGKLTDFDGSVRNTASPKGLLRSTNTTPYTIRITAKKDDLIEYRDINVNVIGTSENAIVNALCQDFQNTFTDENDSLLTGHGDVDLKALLTAFYKSSSYTGTISISLSETENIAINDENAIGIIANGVKSNTITVAYDAVNGLKLSADNTPVSSLKIAMGMMILSDELTVNFTSGEETTSAVAKTKMSAKSQIIYYLKDTSAAFTTNVSYFILNLRDTNDDAIIDALYSGANFVTSAKLGLTNLSYRLVTITSDVRNEVLATTYFTLTDNGYTLSIISSDINIPSNLYLEYSYEFSDGTTGIFDVKIAKAGNGLGGDDQQFESNNPFDKLFLNSEINWLIGGTFEVPNGTDDSGMYANIEIVSINAETYNSSTHKMCQITYGGNMATDVNNVNYYKSVSFNVNPNYIPTSNSLVKVKCSYYDNVSESIILIQTYTITIQGIYKCGDNATLPSGYTPYVFCDRNFYNMTTSLMQAFSSAYVNAINDSTLFLLSDSSYANLVLDYSSLPAPTESINLMGIERLTHVTGIILDNIAINDMTAFGNFSNSKLTYVSLSGCGITDDILYGTNNQSHLYSLNLTDVNLSNNSISRTDNLVKRTVTSLKLANQTIDNNKVLTDISGLSNVYLLQILDISDNAIYRFDILSNHANLTTVYLYNNRVENDFTMYGTNGYLNIPHYVNMLKNNVAIYAYANDLTDALIFSSSTVATLFSNGGDITPSMKEGSVALNALAINKKLYDAEGKAKAENDITSLYISENIDSGSYNGVTGGSDPDVTNSVYSFHFYNIATNTTSNTMSFIKFDNASYSVVTSVNGSISAPVECSYVIAIEDSIGNIIAYREYIVDVCYQI